MKTKIFVAAVAATMFATPVLADFFIVREGVKGPCRVVDTRPTDARILVVGNKAYTVREDARGKSQVFAPQPLRAQLLRPRPRLSCPPLCRPHLLRPSRPGPACCGPGCSGPGSCGPVFLSGSGLLKRLNKSNGRNLR